MYYDEWSKTSIEGGDITTTTSMSSGKPIIKEGDTPGLGYYRNTITIGHNGHKESQDNRFIPCKTPEIMCDLITEILQERIKKGPYKRIGEKNI